MGSACSTSTKGQSSPRRGGGDTAASRRGSDANNNGGRCDNMSTLGDANDKLNGPTSDTGGLGGEYGGELGEARAGAPNEEPDLTEEELFGKKEKKKKRTEPMTYGERFPFRQAAAENTQRAAVRDKLYHQMYIAKTPPEEELVPPPSAYQTSTSNNNNNNIGNSTSYNNVSDPTAAPAQVDSGDTHPNRVITTPLDGGLKGGGLCDDDDNDGGNNNKKDDDESNSRRSSEAGITGHRNSILAAVARKGRGGVAISPRSWQQQGREAPEASTSYANSRISQVNSLLAMQRGPKNVNPTINAGALHIDDFDKLGVDPRLEARRERFLRRQLSAQAAAVGVVMEHQQLLMGSMSKGDGSCAGDVVSIGGGGGGGSVSQSPTSNSSPIGNLLAAGRCMMNIGGDGDNTNNCDGPTTSGLFTTISSPIGGDGNGSDPTAFNGEMSISLTSPDGIVGNDVASRDGLSPRASRSPVSGGGAPLAGKLRVGQQITIRTDMNGGELDDGIGSGGGIVPPTSAGTQLLSPTNSQQQNGVGRNRSSVVHIVGADKIWSGPLSAASPQPGTSGVLSPPPQRIGVGFGRSPMIGALDGGASSAGGQLSSRRDRDNTSYRSTRSFSRRSVAASVASANRFVSFVVVDEREQVAKTEALNALLLEGGLTVGGTSPMVGAEPRRPGALSLPAPASIILTAEEKEMSRRSKLLNISGYVELGQSASSMSESPGNGPIVPPTAIFGASATTPPATPRSGGIDIIGGDGSEPQQPALGKRKKSAAAEAFLNSAAAELDKLPSRMQSVTALTNVTAPTSTATGNTSPGDATVEGRTRTKSLNDTNDTEIPMGGVSLVSDIEVMPRVVRTSTTTVADIGAPVIGPNGTINTSGGTTTTNTSSACDDDNPLGIGSLRKDSDGSVTSNATHPYSDTAPNVVGMARMLKLRQASTIMSDGSDAAIIVDPCTGTAADINTSILTANGGGSSTTMVGSINTTTVVGPATTGATNTTTLMRAPSMIACLNPLDREKVPPSTEDLLATDSQQGESSEIADGGGGNGFDVYSVGGGSSNGGTTISSGGGGLLKATSLAYQAPNQHQAPAVVSYHVSGAPVAYLTEEVDRELARRSDRRRKATALRNAVMAQVAREEKRQRRLSGEEVSGSDEEDEEVKGQRERDKARRAKERERSPSLVDRIASIFKK